MNQLTIQQVRKEYRNQISIYLEALGYSKGRDYWIIKSFDFPQVISFDIHWGKLISFKFALSIRSEKPKKNNECEIYRPVNGLLNDSARTIWAYELSEIKFTTDEIKKHVVEIFSFLIKEGVFKRFNEIAEKKVLISYLQNINHYYDFYERYFTSNELIEMISNDSE